METKTIKQVVEVNADPHEVYEALMDSKKHSELTASEAEISREVGGPFSAYDGSLHGTNAELVPDRKIVQNWRCEMDDWPEDHFSKATFLLKKTATGTKIEFTQTGVPEECFDEISEGWYDYYWTQMKTFFK
ncbi:SRPBCC domain-containing protein [Candidatus Micrarchaeota archaeon]|nr:SRPBCC domain-containing protein [Candidatus Micrarchaeota archaeon]